MNEFVIHDGLPPDVFDDDGEDLEGIQFVNAETDASVDIVSDENESVDGEDEDADNAESTTDGTSLEDLAGD